MYVGTGRNDGLICCGCGVEEICGCCAEEVDAGTTAVEMTNEGATSEDDGVASAGAAMLDSSNIELCPLPQSHASSEDSEPECSAVASEDEELDVSGLAWPPYW